MIGVERVASSSSANAMKRTTDSGVAGFNILKVSQERQLAASKASSQDMIFHNLPSSVVQEQCRRVSSNEIWVIFDA